MDDFFTHHHVFSAQMFASAKCIPLSKARYHLSILVDRDVLSCHRQGVDGLPLVYYKRCPSKRRKSYMFLNS